MQFRLSAILAVLLATHTLAAPALDGTNPPPFPYFPHRLPIAPRLWRHVADRDAGPSRRG